MTDSAREFPSETEEQPTLTQAPPSTVAPTVHPNAGGTPPLPPQASPSSAFTSSRRWPWAAGGGLIAAAIVTVLVLVVFHSSTNDASTYQDRMATVLRPVITANRDVSSALEALHGTNTALARRRVETAESATTAARGGLEALTVPAAADQMATNARGTLTREAAYLDAVRTALRDPASGSAAQTQTLAANLTGALDVVAPSGEDWAASVRGADRLTAWAPKAVAAEHRKAAAARRAHTPATTPASSTPAASSGGTDCGDGLHAGPNTSCPFAENVQTAYNEAPGAAATVQVYSPVTARTYTMSCAPAGTGVTCSGGNDASVSWSY